MIVVAIIGILVAILFPPIYKTYICHKYGKGSSAPTNTKSKSNNDNSGMGYRKEGMPRHLVEELDILDNMEVALDYWMQHFNFVYKSNELVAYNESICADAGNKQPERQLKNVPIQDDSKPPGQCARLRMSGTCITPTSC